MINSKIEQILLERFGEPIGDTKTSIGVADERKDLDEADPTGYSHKVKITHKDDDVDLALDKMRDDEAVHNVNRAVNAWVYSKAPCVCVSLDTHDKQDGTIMCKDCKQSWMPEDL